MKNLLLKTLIVILIFSIVSTINLMGQSNSLQENNARADSLARDSVARVIASEEVATLVPSHYATLIVEINATIIPHINTANGIVNDPEIDALQQNHSELSRLTDYVISRNNILEGIESIEKQ